MTHLVGVDVGGTFTDVLLMPLDGGPAVLAKVPTTSEPADGVVRGILEAVERARVEPGASTPFCTARRSRRTRCSRARARGSASW